MSLPGAKIHRSGDVLFFHCPGCGYAHGPDGRWTWNGSFTAPTLQPSVLVQGQFRCHSFVTDGRIQFLSDCDHPLAGQTVDLEAWDDESW